MLGRLFSRHGILSQRPYIRAGLEDYLNEAALPSRDPWAD
jgi:hypothetical protein